jgi:ribosomal protein S3AE
MVVQKKKFIEIELPIVNEITTALGNLESLQGKTIKLDLARRMRGKGLEITFQILNNKGYLIGIPKVMCLTKSYIRRIMRTSISYVEDSFQTETKDGIHVSVKPFLITRMKVSRAVRNHLRVEAKKLFTDVIKERNYIEICTDLYLGSFQKLVQPKLKKIYPLAFCDLRIFETKEIAKVNLERVKKVEKRKEIQGEGEASVNREGSPGNDKQLEEENEEAEKQLEKKDKEENKEEKK